MNLFKRKCKHIWEKEKRSNILQLSDAGNPARLFVCRCAKCNKKTHIWFDVQENELDELMTGESVLVEWSNPDM